MQVAKWGNSLGIRLPVALVKKLGIREGDDLVLVPARSHGVAAAKVSLVPGKMELLQAMRRYRAPWPQDFEFDRDEANAR